VTLLRDVKLGTCVTWDDVRIDEADDAYRYRREMEALGEGAVQRVHP
jgi:hypothetical protein